MTTAIENTVPKTFMSRQDVAEEAKALWVTNPYLRAIHYCREATIYGRSNTHIALAPRVVSPFLVGHAGYGKTSTARQYAREMGIGYIERSLAGINDIAEVLGMVTTKINPDTGETETVLAAPKWWPKEGTRGILNFDDWTRATPAMISATMMLADGAEVNDLKLPIGWTVIFTGNPEDEYQVTSLDDAQSSRAVVLGYNRPNAVFYEQMEIQDVDPDLKDFWTIDTAQVDCKVATITRPPNNDRTKMIYDRIYKYAKYDEEVEILVANAMFGPEWLVAFKSARNGMRPPRPEQILNDFESIKAKIYEASEMQRTDIMSSMTFQVISHMVVKTPAGLSKEQYQNFEKFAMMLPESEINRLVKNLGPFLDAISAATMTEVNGTRQNGQFSRKAAEIRREMARLDV